MASKYDRVIEKVFFNNYNESMSRILFDREELAQACQTLDIASIKNLGDIVYSYRFRKNLPKAIENTTPSNHEWIIVGAGIGMYEFRLSVKSKIEPAKNKNTRCHP
ncbi:hypothetical protein QUF76_16550 [Desulfobacterales bacterium HSG16]|nr:hypothetical protein [Desulfobacterales bacterium HSG16]